MYFVTYVSRSTVKQQAGTYLKQKMKHLIRNVISRCSNIVIKIENTSERSI